MKNKSFRSLRRIHGHIHNFAQGFKLRKEYKQRFKDKPNTVFLVLTPEHGNIGDHAIALAETRLLKDAGIDYIEITGKQLTEMRRAHQLWVMNGFPILVNGGGNLGTLWFGVEKQFRSIIRNNPASSILCFPNTIFYDHDANGENEFRKSIRLYNSHKNLYLYAREKYSYEIMKLAYRNVKLVPDIVLSLPAYKSGLDRNGCLLCLRSDCERTRTEEQDELLLDQCEALFPNNIHHTDMVVDHSVTVAQREEEVIAKLNEFSSAELVVTDRLHGMIFCALTGTPCIVVNSKSPKVLGCYKWIKDLEYIRFAGDILDIEKEYSAICSTNDCHYSNSHLEKYFKELLEDIKRHCL